ncbi:MAG: hypothetical protein M1831_006737 [Alyxoria varia]|nr:MAG: hypothetical protein M1831_006737 [Alyxoria varia]
MEPTTSHVSGYRPRNPSPLSLITESGSPRQHTNTDGFLHPSHAYFENDEPSPFIPDPEDHTSLDMTTDQELHADDDKSRYSSPKASSESLYRSQSYPNSEPSSRSNRGKIRRSCTGSRHGSKHGSSRCLEELRRMREPPTPPLDSMLSIASQLEDCKESDESSNQLFRLHARGQSSGSDFEYGSESTDNSGISLNVQRTKPRQVRVRKSSAPSAYQQSRSALSLLDRRNTSSGMCKRHASDSALHTSLMSKKSCPAEAATTRIATHIFSPDDPYDEDEESMSLMRSPRRRHSATLQVVRSRRSVYEVIWEDTLVRGSTPGSEYSGSLALSGPTAEGAESALAHIDTKLAGWSWEEGSELEKFEPETETTASPMPILVPSNTLESQSSLAEKSEGYQRDVRLGQPKSKPAQAMQTPSDDSPLPRAAGKRKLGNVEDDDTFYIKPRKSLTLAHDRIAHEQRATKIKAQAKSSRRPAKSIRARSYHGSLKGKPSAQHERSMSPRSIATTKALPKSAPQLTTITSRNSTPTGILVSNQNRETYDSDRNSTDTILASGSGGRNRSQHVHIQDARMEDFRINSPYARG